MICPSCKTVVDVPEGACPTCQGDAHPSTTLAPYYHAAASLPVGERPGARILESPAKTAISSHVSVSSVPAVVSSFGAGVPWRGSGQSHPMLAALPRLPALLWRQPIVRATVRTGASAVVLSLALRMAGRMLSTRATAARTASTALPALANLLTAPDASTHRRTRRPRRRATDAGEAIETLIYIRRVSRDAR